MNNTINNTNSVSFNARYLVIKDRQKIPQQISDAIYKSDAIDEFLKAGKPKTLLGKIKDLFVRDKILSVRYDVSKIDIQESIPKEQMPIIERLRDPYQKVVSLIFEFDKKGYQTKAFKISGEQRGIKRRPGSVPKQNEHYGYRPPVRTAEDELAEKIEKLTDIQNLLKEQKTIGFI